MHLIIWETLHFQGFNMDMVFYSTWTSIKVDKARPRKIGSEK